MASASGYLRGTGPNVYFGTTTVSLVAILQSTSIYDACLGTSSLFTMSYTHFGLDLSMVGMKF
jgi:hypothetical protein